MHIMAGSPPKYERRTTMQPCLDDFNTTFDDYAAMQTYHARQTRESRWARRTVSGLHIEPLDEASPLYTDDKAFAPDVSQVAVSDTARNLGLALLTEDGVSAYPKHRLQIPTRQGEDRRLCASEAAKAQARRNPQRMPFTAQIGSAAVGEKRKGGGIPFRG